MTTTAVRPPAAAAPARRSPALVTALLLACAVTAGGVLAGALLLGHAIEPVPTGDLPYPGLGTEWALPVLRVVHDLAAITTLGFLLLAVALIPDQKGALRTTAKSALVRARIAAAVWFIALLAEAVFNLSLSAASPVSSILSFDLVWQYLTQILEGQVALAGMVAAAVIVFAPPIEKANPAAVLFGIAGVGLVLPPLLTGHSASASGHDLAMTSLSIHVLAASLWIGGLAGVGWLASRGAKALAVALPRFSTLALGAYVAVGLSGVVNAAIRLGRVDALWQDRYGLLVLGKTLLLVVLGALGYLHRRRTVAPAAAGDRRAFLRLAAVELTVMSAAVGLAVALSRSPTPIARSVPDVSIAKAALGYELPGPVSVERLLLWAQPQLLFLLAVIAGAVLYARSAHRLRARGDSWGRGRSTAWYGGLAIVALATQSGLSRYGGVLFSVHMAQHMLLAMVAPPLLALGAPVTLALRVLPSRPAPVAGRSLRADGGEEVQVSWRGARGWLLAALRSPLLRVLSNPVVALAIFVVSTFGLYFSPLFEALMRQHAGHLLMEVHFLISGCLLFWPILSPDPLPNRPSHPVRMLLLILTMPFHAFFGLAVMSSNQVLAGGWFGTLGRTWGASLLADQRTGGGIAMALGEPIALFAAAAIFVQWYRADERDARTQERQAERDPDGDEHAVYNRYLADLARRR